MSLIVQKFGGTSVGTVERIKAVAQKVAGFREQGHDIIVVVSAMSGETNRLIELAKAMQATPTPRELDVLVSTGEQVTISLLCMALHDLGQGAKSYTGTQVRILTDEGHGRTDMGKQVIHVSFVVLLGDSKQLEHRCAGITPPVIHQISERERKANLRPRLRRDTKECSVQHLLPFHGSVFGCRQILRQVFAF